MKTTQGCHPPEEALAALTGHGIKVKAGGLVATHTTDSRSIAVELVRPDHWRRHRDGLHHWRENEEREKRLECDTAVLLIFFFFFLQMKDLNTKI